MKKQEIILKDPLIKVLTISSREENTSKTKKKAFILFGEHSRELISSETGFHILTKLCQETNSNVLNKFILKMIIIANPTGRKIVEGGNFCWRGNKNKVDLNRNWGFQWKPKRPIDNVVQTDPGNKKFSEPETRAIEKTISSFKPDVFLSIHSGMNALMFPYAYSMKTRIFQMILFFI